MLFLLLLGAVSNLYANRLVVNDNINYGNNLELTYLMQNMSIKIKGRYSVLTDHHVVDGLTNHDRVQIRLQTPDGRWYHTRFFTLPSDQHQHTTVLSINGNYGPLNITANNQVISKFYNQQNWPSSPVRCEGIGLIVASYQCTFNGPNSVKKSVSRLYNGINVGIFAGTGYFNPSIKVGDEVKLFMTSVLFYSRIDWDDGTGRQVGYANAGGIGVGLGGAPGEFQ